MFSALPTVEHEQVLRSFVREETILRYLKDQASTSSSSCSNGYRLGVRYADFYFVPSPNSNSSITSEGGDKQGNTTTSLRRFRLGNGFLSAYCDDDCSPRVDERLLAALGVSMQGAIATTNERPKAEVDAAAVSGGSHLDATTLRVTEADMRELEGPLLQSTVRILTLLDVVRTVLFGKGLLTVSSAGSPLSDPRRGKGDVFGEEATTSAAQQHQHGEIAQTPLSEASTAIRRRIFPGILPVPVAVKNRPDGDAIDFDDERIIIGDVGVGEMGSSDDGDDARLRSVIAAAYNVAKDEFQCTGGGGIRSSAARSYLVRSVAYMQRIRDRTAQNNGGGPTHKQSSQGFLWEVARTCQECVNQLEELDKNFMFSSARDEFYECIGDIGADGVPMTETVLVVCGEEVKASFAFFQDAAHSLYSWAMNCMEMVDAYEQQGLLPAATTVTTPLHTTTTTSLQTKTLTSRGGNEGEEDGTTREEENPIRDVSSSYLSLEDRAQSMYEYPQSAVTTQSTQFIDIMSAAAQALQSPPQLAATCPLTARLNASCSIYVSGQRLLSVPYFSSIRQLILSVERETERVNRLSNNIGNDDDAQATASNGVGVRLSPPASRFQFLLDTLRLYYITSVTADEKKTLEHFGSVTVALLSELAAEKALMEVNRGAILTSLQARWEARQLEKREGGSDGGDEEDEEDYYLPDPLLPLYTKEERHTLTVSFGAFFRTRSAIRGLIGALQKDIMRRNRTHGVVMVTATVPTSSSTRSGLFSASVVPLVVRHYRTQKGKAQPNQTSPGRTTSKQQQQRSPMENTSVRTVSAMESDENYFQGADGSSSSLFVSPRHFYESGKNFLVRQGSRLPTLKVPLPTSTLAEWRRLVTEVPVVMRRSIETGCSSSRRHDDGVVHEDRDPRSTMYPVSMVPIGGGGVSPTAATRASSAVRLEGVVEEEVQEGPTSVGVDEDVNSWGSSSPLRILQGMWKTISCSLSPVSEEVQGARRFPSGPPPPVGESAVFKGPPKSVVSPLVYRKEALLIALIDADNESQRMHEALVAEYPTLYAAGSSCASAERMKTASMRFATAFMPPAAAAATERDEERGPVVEGIIGTTDKIIATIQSRTRALLDLAEVRKTQEEGPGNTNKRRGEESNNTTLLSHVARVAQQYSIVFDPPK